MDNINAVVITVSDTREEATDASGRKLCELLMSGGARVVEKLIVIDDRPALAEVLAFYADRPDVNLILTTGGTGLATRDVTPDATSDVIEREVPGIAEAMRMETMKDVPTAILSRGLAGSRNGTLIINLPGSPGGVAECFEVIRPVLSHAVRILAGDTAH